MAVEVVGVRECVSFVREGQRWGRNVGLVKHVLESYRVASLVPRPCFIKVTGGKTGPGRHCQGRSAHALVCPRIPGVTVISFWKPFRILV